jgi:ABC-2 type transport system ATP-binding protein
MSVIECRELGRSFGEVTAVEAVSFTMEDGEFLALLGPNGAGKSTLLHMLTTLIAPSRGEARVCGIDAAKDPLAARARLAYIPETVMLYGALTGLENLAYFVEVSGLEASPAELAPLLRAAGLSEEAAGRPVRGYSKGMRQKVGVAIALARRAQALLLDEPTSGLDPLAANEFAALVDGLRRDGLAVLMVTHDLFLAKQCGTRIGIMADGRLARVFDADDVDHLGLERAYVDLFATGQAA